MAKLWATATTAVVVLSQSLLQSALWLQHVLCIVVVIALVLLLTMVLYCKSSGQQARANFTSLKALKP